MRVNGALTALRSVIQKFDASVCARVSGGAVRHQQAPYRCGLNRRQRWARELEAVWEDQYHGHDLNKKVLDATLNIANDLIEAVKRYRDSKKDERVTPWITTSAIEQRARRRARRVGLRAEKSRRRLSVDNHGGFRLIDPATNVIEVGEKFNMSSEQVIEYCKPTLTAFL